LANNYIHSIQVKYIIFFLSVFRLLGRRRPWECDAKKEKAKAKEKEKQRTRAYESRTAAIGSNAKCRTIQFSSQQTNKQQQQQQQ
jgi:hypothetical protein